MTLSRVNLRFGVWLLVVLLLLAAVLFFVGTQPVTAIGGIPLTCSPSLPLFIPAGETTVVSCTGPTPVTYQGSQEYYCGLVLSVKSTVGDNTLVGVGWNTGGDSNAEAPMVLYTGLGIFPLFQGLIGCETTSHIHPVAPAIWAADLCVGDDGHDANGWLTLDSEVGPYPPVLYVAAGPDGPWYETEFLQPPYVMSYADTAGLAAWMGVATEGDLWFKGSQWGTPANLASMIADRAAHMDELCGVE